MTFSFVLDVFGSWSNYHPQLCCLIYTYNKTVVILRNITHSQWHFLLNMFLSLLIPRCLCTQVRKTILLFLLPIHPLSIYQRSWTSGPLVHPGQVAGPSHIVTNNTRRVVTEFCVPGEDTHRHRENMQTLVLSCTHDRLIYVSKDWWYWNVFSVSETYQLTTIKEMYLLKFFKNLRNYMKMPCHSSKSKHSIFRYSLGLLLDCV